MQSRTSVILDYAPAAPRIGRMSIVAIAAVFIAHGVLQFLLYRGRVVSHWSVADSDLFVFGLPNLLALSAYATIFSWMAMKRTSSASAKVAFVVLLTIVVGFFSMWGSMLVPFNTYGT
jgi:hypothetical protein